jgi:hypothetical protein
MSTTEPIIGLSITAVPIAQHIQPLKDGGRHQVRIGLTHFMYFSPEVAAQWLPVIQKIAEEK